MSDPQPLKLVALVSETDTPLIPPLQQVIIFIYNLGFICEVEPKRLPKEPFELSICSYGGSEDSDGGIAGGGIDALGQV